MKKILAFACSAVLLGTLLAGCGNGAGTSGGSSSSSNVSGNITASGSSALYPLVNVAKDQFKKKYPDVSITLNAGGSGTGLKQVSDGTVDIGNSDVEAKGKVDDSKLSNMIDHKICVIGMAAVVSPDVGDKVANLTTDQLISIFTAKTTNWKDVGGPDEKITLVTRPTTSGTRATFKQYALGGSEEASNKSMESDDSGTLYHNISSTKGAIGYLALSYLINNSGVKTVAIDGVNPTLDNIYNGKYKVWTYEHMYTNGQPKGAVKAFLSYMQSDNFANSVETLGYNVTSKMKATH